MKKNLWILLIIVAVIVVIFSFFGGKYNAMVDKSTTAEKAWANVETQYQRRADLIPNFVNTVKGYAEHEKSVLEGVVQARAQATQTKISFDDINDGTLAKYQQSQGEISQALGRLLAITENYPDLKANQNFAALQDELAGTENRIAVARKDFNEAITDYNVYVKKFPNNIIAGMFSFTPKAMFASEAGAEKAPQVQF
ncbi:LemA family protein [Mucinivorans hirudinis]|uniref:LemA family protein n=1 Tax=Mucinivorans hirudinis TaxID=1433126 RepID=A0A060R7V3_9BACT|nr:LemA family protein [Mucinivorans hirudinis]